MELAVLQVLVRRWCVRAFGQAVADDRRERNHRFLEEALELCQSLGCTAEDAHLLVDYVYGRPAGRPEQEVGGVMITLAALCGAHRDLSLDMAAKLELARVNRPEALEKIRAKQAAKARDIPLSPLPGTLPGPPLMHELCTTNLLDVRTNQDSGPRWWCPQCRVEVPPENTQPQPVETSIDTRDLVSGRTLRENLERTHTDAVGTDGCRATVSRRMP